MSDFVTCITNLKIRFEMFLNAVGYGFHT